MPVIQPYILEPIWEQFCALLPEREVNHPLGCHRPRIPDKVVFEKLVQVLVFGCAYWRIADEKCSTTTLRRRRDEWIEAGVMDELRGMVLEAYDQAKEASSARWSWTLAVSPSGSSSPQLTAMIRCSWPILSTLSTPWESCPIGQPYISTAPTTPIPPARSWQLTA